MTSAHSEDELFVLRNASDMRLTISERGAALVSWWAPDRYGRLSDVLLGYRDWRGYRDNRAQLGAVSGRSTDGEDLHRARWRASASAEQGVALRIAAPDLELCVHYQLGDDGSLRIDYEAVADAPTPVDLTVHPYFNLNGGSADVGDHMLQIDADCYLEIGDDGVPVTLASVAGTAFDFRQPAPIGPRLVWPDPQLQLAGGFDHCYALSPARGLREVARVCDPGSGRELRVSTTEPGLQFYSGNGLAGVDGRGPRPYARHDGFCLQAHACADPLDGPQAAFILRPGEVYRQTTVYRLGCS
jgi:aldose 1-epimerase